MSEAALELSNRKPAGWRRRASYAGFVVVLIWLPFGLGGQSVYLGALVFATAVGVLGLNFIIHNTGQVSIGHAATQALGAYAAGYIATSFHMSFPAGLIAGAISAALVGLVVAAASVRLQGPYFAVITLALAWAIGEFLLLFPGITGGYSGLYVRQFNILVLTPTASMYYIALLVLLLCMGAISSLQRSLIGSGLLLTRTSRPAARAIGIETAGSTIIAVTAGNALAGISGVLYLYLVSGITPSAFGIVQSVYFLVASVVGGVATPVGALLGAAVIVLLPQKALAQDGNVASIALGVLLLLSVIFFPNGLADFRLGRVFTRLSFLHGCSGESRFPRRGDARGADHVA